ncbi:MAG: GrpB family protein [Janthinobacterium lividum]
MDEVVLATYDPSWPVIFLGEAQAIRQALGDVLIGVEHVGSTAIPGLAAKPIIDIVASVTTFAAGTSTIPALEALGYDCRGECGIPGRLFFRKGVIDFKRTHHLHLVEAGHEQWNSMRLFRDYLRSHPGEAQRYEALKHTLAERFRDNRAAYTKGKARFIQAVLEKTQIGLIPERGTKE